MVSISPPTVRWSQTIPPSHIFGFHSMATLHNARRVVLSLSGSGHLLVYQLGACRFLLKQPNLVVTDVVGASGGSIAATLVAARLSLDDYAQAFIQKRGNGLELLLEFWDDKYSQSSADKEDDSTTTSVGLHIATTRCEDGASKVFSFTNLKEPTRIFDCLRASCLLPPTFHPLDMISSSPDPYPDNEGIPIDDPIVGTQFYVDGGIATPAPMLLDEDDEDALSTYIIVSPVAGTSTHTLRLSPSSTARWWCPQLQFRYDMGCYMSWSNLKALRAASGVVTSSELQDWYERGQDDALRFIKDLE